MDYTGEMLDTKRLNECWRDITWYCIDSAGQIAIVASGGGLLPQSIVNIFEKELIIVDNYFDSLPFIATAAFFTDFFLEGINRKENLKFKESNIDAMTTLVLKGLYSFDKPTIMNHGDFEYRLEARPDVPLTINDIDKDILKIIEKTRLNINFKTDDLFYVNEIE